MTRPSLLVSLGALDHVGTGDDRGDVRRDPLGRLEGPRGGALAGRDGLGRGGVGDDLPRRGRGDRELEGGLEVRLLEGRVDAAGVGDLELRVEVDLAVDGVDEAVQALTRVRVRGVGDHAQRVLRGEPVELDPGVGEDGRGVEALPVEGDLVDRRGDQVDEGGRAGLRGEPDLGGRPEGLGTGREVQVDHVRVDRDDAGAGGRFDAGQVLSGHGRLLGGCGAGRLRRGW